MCGIVGYVGAQSPEEFLLDGLRRLEYRGYDSAGLATFGPEGEFCITKAVGKVEALARKTAQAAPGFGAGIGHTRWATHGEPSEVNAHPHLGGEQTVALVHNGVIENYAELKAELQAQGYRFVSATDTEVIAHLVADGLRDAETRLALQPDNYRREDPHAPLLFAVRTALARLRGTYALAILFRDYPGVIVVARHGSPLVIGLGEGEQFIASDHSPLVGRTERVVYLADKQLAVVTAAGLRVVRRDVSAGGGDFSSAAASEVEPVITPLRVASEEVELGGFAHYMLKEIYEQPQSLAAALRGRLCADDAVAVFHEFDRAARKMRRVNRIVLTACGTSWHAALVGEYLIEEFARIPVEVEYASELRYRNPPVEHDTLLFAISQSGETADTLAALRELKRKGHPTLAICNVAGSTIAHEADSTLFLHAGPEIGVASTKAYTSQVVLLAMLALHFGRQRHLSFEAGERVLAQLRQLPEKVEQALECNAAVRRIAEKYAGCENFLYLGRQYNFPTALEGALKLKEISYIHAEGYPAAEMKHGPIALVDRDTPSVFLMPPAAVYDKVVSNLEEIKARGGPVIAVAAEGDQRVQRLADDVIYVPAVEEFLSPLVNIVPLQLLAYHIAVLRGCDVDKPRNLAKSVTVE